MSALLQLFVTVVMAQTESIYTIVHDSIITDTQFIDEFDQEIYDNITPFSLKGSQVIDSLPDAYTVNVMRYKGWDLEAGFGEVIDIKCKEKSVLQLKNSEQWAFLYGDLKKYSDNPYFVPIPIDASSMAILFVGFIRANQPAFVTIVLLRDGQATLVYNKSLLIESVVKSASTFAINLSDDTGGDPVVNNYSIWVEEGVLKFRKI